MRCEHCGHEQQSGRICESCGLMLARATDRSAPAAPTEQVPALLHCDQCGHEQASGKFCDACGLRITVYQPPAPQHDSSESPRNCPTCGVPIEGVICRNCGIRIPPSEAEES
jgi:ribosomal protein L32